MEKEWKTLTSDEKREKRFQKWLSSDNINFLSPEAEKAYKTRVTRLIKAIKLEEPDRVPVMLPSGFLPAYYAGGTLKKCMYDYDELKRAWLKFLHDFDMDTFAGPTFVLPGKVLDSIDFKLQHWPGHGLADDISSYQFIEGEYMQPDEYDPFIKNSTDFIFRTFLPRTVGGFSGFGKLSPLTPLVGIPVYFISQFSNPEIRASVQLLLDAADECAKWQSAIVEIDQAIRESGVPSIWGGLSGAPYDFIGDVMRGTKGIMMDMYRQPDKLLEAMERLTPIVIEKAVGASKTSASPVVLMPLHKGTGGFMSNEQFKTFYWPTLKKVMMGLIDEGLVPLLFAEGDYGERLEIIKDMPRGTVIWYFETMDMAKAKAVLGDNACIAGNLPVSILCTGTPQQVKEGCRQLIEICAPGGGYILTASASMNQGDANNLHAMMDAAKEYGMYT